MMTAPTECSDIKREGYLAWHAKAQEFAAAGQRQTQCAVCGLWLWPCEAKQCSRFYPSDSQPQEGRPDDHD